MENKVIIQVTEKDIEKVLEDNPDIRESIEEAKDSLTDYISLRMAITERMNNFLHERFNGMEDILDTLEDVMHDLEDKGFRRTKDTLYLSEPILVDADEEDDEEDYLPCFARGFILPVRRFDFDSDSCSIGCLYYGVDENGNIATDVDLMSIMILTETTNISYTTRIMKALIHNFKENIGAEGTLTYVLENIGYALDNNYTKLKGADRIFVKSMHKCLNELERTAEWKLPKLHIVQTNIEGDPIYLHEITPIEKILRETVLYIRKQNKCYGRRKRASFTEDEMRRCLKKFNFLQEENWVDKILNSKIPL